MIPPLPRICFQKGWDSDYNSGMRLVWHRMRGWVLASAIVLILGTAPQLWGARTVLDLSGSWQYQKASQLNYPPGNDWQPITVPGYLTSANYEHAWYRKTFTLRAPPAGGRAKLRFGGAKFASQV